MSREPNLAVRCIKCRKHVTPIEHGHWLIDDPFDRTDANRHTLGECPECSHVLLIKIRSSEERQWGDPELLYPTENTELDESVPRSIADSYQEAARAMSVDAHTATAIMCRRTLEGICAHHKADGKNLSQKLKSLRDQGTIDARIFEWADSVLRHLGNDAAHNVDEVISAEDAEAALDFTKAIIEYLFVFSSAFERFKERREKKGNGSTPK